MESAAQILVKDDLKFVGATICIKIHETCNSISSFPFGGVLKYIYSTDELFCLGIYFALITSPLRLTFALPLLWFLQTLFSSGLFGIWEICLSILIPRVRIYILINLKAISSNYLYKHSNKLWIFITVFCTIATVLLYRVSHCGVLCAVLYKLLFNFLR